MSAPSDAPAGSRRPAVLHRLLPDRVLRGLAREAGSAFVLYAFGAALSFLLNVVLARVLGASGAGAFFLAFTALTVASLVGRLGLDNALLRFSGAFAGSDEWERVAGVERTGIRLALVGSVAAALAVVLLSGWLARDLFRSPDLVLPIRILALAVVPFALSRLYGELLKGVSRVRSAVLVQNVLVPVVALPLILLMGREWDVPGATLAYLVASGMAAVIGWWLWRRAVPAGPPERSFPVGRLLRTSFPLFWVAGLDLVMRSVDVIALGTWWSTEEVGVYGVAARVSLLTSYVLVSVNAVAAPRFAALHARGEPDRLEGFARKATLLIALLTLPALLLLLAVPASVLGLFGSEFRAGAGALTVLIAGQLVNVATGPVGYLLMMSGHEKLMRNNVAAAAVLNVLLNVVLVPPFGIMGAAVATAVSLAVMNVVSAVLVHRALGILTLPLPIGSGSRG